MSMGFFINICTSKFRLLYGTRIYYAGKLTEGIPCVSIPAAYECRQCVENIIQYSSSNCVTIYVTNWQWRTLFPRAVELYHVGHCPSSDVYAIWALRRFGNCFFLNLQVVRALILPKSRVHHACSNSVFRCLILITLSKPTYRWKDSIKVDRIGYEIVNWI
jgi:hypothetical protein